MAAYMLVKSHKQSWKNNKKVLIQIGKRNLKSIKKI
jgi:hypothetical protein